MQTLAVGIKNQTRSPQELRLTQVEHETEFQVAVSNTTYQRRKYKIETENDSQAGSEVVDTS